MDRIKTLFTADYHEEWFQKFEEFVEFVNIIKQ